MLEVQAAGISDPGPNREINEDYIGSFAPDDEVVRQRKGCLYVLADGVGGQLAGEVASATAVTTVLQEYYAPTNHARIEPALRHAVQTANLSVHNLSLKHAEYTSMQTTLIALALVGSQAYIAHIGDSRAYHWRAGRLTQLTNDHSEAAELARMRLVDPARIRDHPRRSVLTRALGGVVIVRPDFLRQSLQVDDRFLLCTDGVWAELSDDEIAEALASEDPDVASRTLIDLALGRDCQDNVSVQVVKIASVAPDPEPAPARNGWLPNFLRRSRKP
jgi:PPM family protein phosphatase